MNQKFRLKTIALVLTAILAIAMLSLLSNTGTQEATLDTQSFDPGGTAAFANWLQAVGYKVHVEGSDSIAVKPGELEIVMVNTSKVGQQPGTFDYVRKNIRSTGGNLLIMQYREVDIEKNALTDSVSVNALGTDQTFKLFLHSELYRFDPEFNNKYPVATSIEDPTDWAGVIAPLSQNSNALEAEIPADLACNAYLGSENNAQFLNYLISRLSPTKTIVINREFTRSDTASIFELLGPWAQQGWDQTILLFAVIAVTVSLRFGIPTTHRFRQVSSRTFADAIAGSIQRTRGVDSACNRIFYTYEKRIRNHFGVSKVATKAARNEAIPPELAAALDNIEMLLGQNTKANELLKAVQTLESVTTRLAIKPATRFHRTKGR